MDDPMLGMTHRSSISIWSRTSRQLCLPWFWYSGSSGWSLTSTWCWAECVVSVYLNLMICSIQSACVWVCVCLHPMQCSIEITIQNNRKFLSSLAVSTFFGIWITSTQTISQILQGVKNFGQHKNNNSNDTMHINFSSKLIAVDDCSEHSVGFEDFSSAWINNLSSAETRIWHT